MKKLWFAVVCFAAVTFSFAGELKLESGKWNRSIVVEGEYNGEKFSQTVHIYIPSGVKPGSETLTLILLNDLMHSSSSWISDSNFARLAGEKKMILVAPDMGSSVFEWEYFPETKKKWSPVPGAKYVGEYLIPFLQKNVGICKSREKTGIVGIGNGARGAFLVASRYPQLIKTVAGFSGFYDNQTMTRSSALSNVYGDYKKNKERWETSDNLMKLADSLGQSVVFISHGSEDFNYSFDQSLLFGIKLNQVKKKNSSMKFKFFEQKNKMHDWPTFNAAAADFIKFINE